MAYRKSKLILFMAAGAFVMALGAVVASNVTRVGASVSPATIVTSVLVATALFFIGGLFWAIVAASLKKLE